MTQGFFGLCEVDPAVVRGWRLANALAVPRTGRRGNCHYFRHPRGKRQALIEGARTIPPSSWDDIQISTRYDRNWKRHRKTQWHDNPPSPQYWDAVRKRRQAKREARL